MALVFYYLVVRKPGTQEASANERIILLVFCPTAPCKNVYIASQEASVYEWIIILLVFLPDCALQKIFT
ncbi:MAG: hypothetical protein IKE03_08830 [Blautia sp.]|nr:hypothetical protein [Blautia sp.]